MLYIGIDGGGTKQRWHSLMMQEEIKRIIKPSVHVLTQPREICIQF